MKLTLCTLAICLSILASVFATRALIREEGRRTRSSLSKGLAEPSDAPGQTEPIARKLDALASQLASLTRRMTALEEAVRPDRPSAENEASRDLQDNLQSLRKELDGATASLARLEGLPNYLTGLSTYLDQSFEHLEKAAAEKPAFDGVTSTLDDLTKKIDAIDSYFVPLYAFLGLVYDPANNDRLATYPSLDERINDMYLQMDAIRQDIAAFREAFTPRNIDPVKHPR